MEQIGAFTFGEDGPTTRNLVLKRLRDVAYLNRLDWRRREYVRWTYNRGLSWNKDQPGRASVGASTRCPHLPWYRGWFLYIYTRYVRRVPK